MKVMECINYIESIIQNNPELLQENANKYCEALQKITHRLKDPYLNVALIGDFSTGKSTFINALTKMNLLKTAWLATTAVPTQIYRASTQNVNVKVILQNGIVCDYTKEKQWKKLKSLLDDPLKGTLEDIIAELTTTNRFAEKIKSVQLYIPADGALRNICIIDTPGVNPGASETKKHVSVTRNVLREYADATIVLFQAQNVYTASFRTFLEENAAHFMNDAVFLVTMMDTLDPEERTEVLEFVRKSLCETFHLNSPVVLGCSAKYVCDNSQTADGIYWRSEFDKIRQQILDYLQARRSTIIKAQLSQLLQQLIQDMNQDITERQRSIEGELKILEENSIENLKKEMNGKKLLYEQKIKLQINISSLYSLYTRTFTELKSIASARINGCTQIRGDNCTAITYYIGTPLSNMVEIHISQLSGKVRSVFSSANPLLDQYVLETSQLFNRYSIAVNRSAGTRYTQNCDMDMGRLGKVYFDDISTAGSALELVGVAAAGIAAIPLAVVDGFFDTDLATTVFDGAVSFMNGIVNLFGNLDKKKAEAITAVHRQLTAMADENRAAFQNMVKTQQNEVLKLLNENNQHYVRQYEKIYRHRMNDFTRQKSAMESVIGSCKQIHKTLEDYALSIEKGRLE